MYCDYFKRVSPFYSSVGLIYLFAFVSLYVQYPGLLGHNGVLPADLFVTRVLSQNESGSGISFLDFPTLLAYAPAWGIPVDCMSDFLMILGSLCSVLIIFGIQHPILFFLCWLTYLSVFLVGQTFLSFQWDILLLEVSECKCHTQIYHPIQYII